MRPIPNQLWLAVAGFGTGGNDSRPLTTHIASMCTAQAPGEDDRAQELNPMPEAQLQGALCRAAAERGAAYPAALHRMRYSFAADGRRRVRVFRGFAVDLSITDDAGCA